MQYSRIDQRVEIRLAKTESRGLYRLVCLESCDACTREQQSKRRQAIKITCLLEGGKSVVVFKNFIFCLFKYVNNPIKTETRDAATMTEPEVKINKWPAKRTPATNVGYRMQPHMIYLSLRLRIVASSAFRLHTIFLLDTVFDVICSSRACFQQWVICYWVTMPGRCNWLPPYRQQPHVCCSHCVMSWCLMSSDVIWHIRDKLWPMPKHGSIKATYVRSVYACLAVTCHLHFLAEWPGFFTCYCGNTGVERIPK